MPSPVINGDRWIEERLAYLQELLASEPSAEQRSLIEAEIAVLSQERGLSGSALRAPRALWRWWRRRRR